MTLKAADQIKQALLTAHPELQGYPDNWGDVSFSHTLDPKGWY